MTLRLEIEIPDEDAPFVAGESTSYNIHINRGGMNGGQRLADLSVVERRDTGELLLSLVAVEHAEQIRVIGQGGRVILDTSTGKDSGQ